MAKHLQAIIYRLLLEEPRTGYSLAKETEKRTGWKPSWGSIYPLLEQLHEEGELRVEEQGRSKIYHLTKEGREAAKKHLEQTNELLRGIIERMRVLQEFTQEDMEMPIAYLNEMLETGINPLADIQEETEAFRKSLMKLWQEKKISENSKKIKEIMKQATKELKAIG